MRHRKKLEHALPLLRRPVQPKNKQNRRMVHGNMLSWQMQYLFDICDKIAIIFVFTDHLVPTTQLQARPPRKKTKPGDQIRDSLLLCEKRRHAQMLAQQMGSVEHCRSLECLCFTFYCVLVTLII